MRIRNNKWIGLFTLSILFVLYGLTGCNEYTTLGDDISSGLNNEEVAQTDTFTINTETIRSSRDSVYSTQMTNVAIGAINTDPIFGNTTAALYSQFGLAQNNEDFLGPDPVLDSVILSVRYSGYYGDSTGKQTYTAYRITDPTFSDTSLKYYTHQKFNIDQGNPLGTITIAPEDISDSIQVVNSLQPAQLRMRLSNSFGNELLTKTANDALATDSSFHQWLNGIALIPDSTTAGKKSMIYFELNDDYTGISVFYHNNKEDSLFKYFPFKAKTGAWSNYRHHDYTGTAIKQAIGNENNDSLIYLQSRSGLFAKIEIPYLGNLDHLLINKAELTFTQIADPSNELNTPPYELFLWQYKDAAQDSLGYLVDVGASYSSYYGWQFTNLSYFGGLREYTTNKEGAKVAQYRFNIARYVQQMVNAQPGEEKNYGLRLGILDPLQRGPNIGRVVLGGGKHSAYKMKLNIVYTKIK